MFYIYSLVFTDMLEHSFAGVKIDVKYVDYLACVISVENDHVVNKMLRIIYFQLYSVPTVLSG